MNVKPNFNEEVPLTNLPLSAPEMEAARTEAVPEDAKETGEKGTVLNKILPFEEYIKKTQLKESDFLETNIYKGLYQISDDFRQGRADETLKKLAYKIGGAKLRNQYIHMKNSYFRQQKKEAKLRKAAVAVGIVDGMTNYTNLRPGSNNLDCGPYWRADDTGIYYLGNKLMPRACSHAILINSIRISIDTGEQKEELLFRKNGRWQTITVDKDMLASAQKITGLHKFGISVTSVNAKQLVAYLQDLEDYSMEKGLIPIIYTTNRMGWNQTKTVFCPYTESKLEYEADGSLSGLGTALKEVGDKEAWIQKVCELREIGIPMLSFLMAANFSAVLVGLLGLDGFVANLYGPSRGGKSVTNKIACTIWAGYTNADEFMLSVDNTGNAVEGILAVLNNIPLILEDANNMTERKQKELQSLIMKICNGVGRCRMRKDLSLRDIYRWNTTGIITSENRIIKDFHNTGSVNRVLMLRGTNEKECPYNQNGLNTAELLDFFGKNHGFAGKAFVEAVLKIGQTRIKERLQEIRAEVSKKVQGTNKSAGQIEPVSVMLLADEIAEEHIFKDKKRISIEEAISWMADEETANQNERFYDSLMDSIIQNSGRFEDLGLTIDMNIQQYWGRYMKNEEKVAIIPKVLKQLADEENLDLKLFLEFLEEKNLIDKDSNGNYTRNVYSTLLHKGTRMYVIKMKKQEDQQDSQSDSDTGNEVTEEIPF